MSDCDNGLQTVRVVMHQAAPLAAGSADAFDHALVLEKGGHVVWRYALVGTTLVIGRVVPASIILDGSTVSRRHCIIDRAGDDVTIMDLGSTNGTFVDGREIMEAVTLTDGARIQIGSHELFYERRRRDAVQASAIGASGVAQARTLMETFELLPIPTVLFADDDSLIACNSAAEDLARTIQEGHFSLFKFLERRLAEHWQKESAPEPRSSDTARAQAAIEFTLKSPDGRSFAARVLRLRTDLQTADSSGRVAALAVLIQEVGKLQPLPGDLLAKLYDLTPAEARLLALLASGRSLEEATATLAIAMSTARTHLHRLFDKTRTGRQAELVRLALSAFPTPFG